MKDYFKPQKIVADYLYFYIDGNKYVGNGIVSWDADTGFSLEGFLDKKNSNFSPIEIRHLKVSTSSDFCSIRIWTKNLGWALIPQVAKSQLLLIPLQENLYIPFSQFILCENSHSYSDQDYWKGKSLYRVNLIDRFPDSVTKEIRLDNILMTEPEFSRGFFYKEKETKILLKGYFLDKENFQLTWSFDKQCYTKSEAWNWSIAFQDALQICLGQNVQLIQREMRRGNKQVIETRKAQKLENLGFLSFFGEAKIHKNRLLHLTKFIWRKEKHYELFKNIFLQILEARRQKLQISESLLIATTLEAIIRTLYDQPTKKSDNSKGLVQKHLNGLFKGNYFLSKGSKVSKEWNIPIERAISAFENLRTKNAHPDWITSEQGMMSDEETLQTLDDMIYLCRFYGYMILAISGIQDLKPNFPEPYQQQQPSTIIQPYDSTQNQPFLESSWIDELSDKLSKSENRYQKMMVWRKVYRN